MYQRNRGFTLTEIVVVLGLLSIIAAFALPAYEESSRKARRIDAQTALLGLASAMERHYAAKSTYLGSDAGADGKGSIPDPAIFPSEAPLDSSVKYYDLRMDITAVSYTLVAYPKGPQEGDGAFRLTSTNARAWDKEDNNTFTSPWQ